MSTAYFDAAKLPDHKIAVYDLAVMPTTFDFACYAVNAKTLGYEEIRFVVGMAQWKYPAEIGWRRWANICIPMCRLAGLKFSVGATLEINGDILGYSTGDVERVYAKTGRIEKLKSVAPPAHSGYVTMTMRESFRNKWRNSDRPEWAKIGTWLAKDLGEEVLVLEECESHPMALEQRMAIYSNAKMNLAVGNGPMVLCWLSEAPYLSFQLPKREGREKDYDALVDQWNRMKFPVGSQCSWRNERQEIVWGPDDFETVKSHFEAMMSKKEASPSASERGSAARA